MNLPPEPIFTSLTFWFLLFYVIIYAIAKIRKNNLKYFKNISGPTPIFPFGNTHEFLGGSVVYLEKLMSFFNEHGDTIILHDGPFSWVMVTIDYELNQKIYGSTEHITKSKQYAFVGDGWLGEGLLTSSGETWKKHRKMITPAFHFSILQEFLPVFDSVGNNLIKKLRQEVGNTSVEISHIISFFALDVICETAMGTRINALEAKSRKSKEYIKSIKTMCAIIVDRTFSAIHPFFYKLSWNYYKERSALKKLMSFFNEHGDTIILHDGPFSWVMVTIDYELNQKIYGSTEHITKSKQYAFVGDGWLGEGLLTSSGETWKKHRKMITPAFHFSILQEFLPVFDSVGNNLIKKLRQEVGNTSVEISHIISFFALDVICETAMGTRINALEAKSRKSKEYIKSIKTMCAIIVDRTFSAIHPFFYKLSWNYYKERSALKKLMSFFNEHGDTIILHDGPFSWVMVTIDYELNQKIYGSTEHITKSKQYAFVGDGWLGEGLLTSSGETWKKHRKMITPAFHFSILQEFLPVFDSVGNNLIKKLRQEVGNTSVEISHIISFFALDVICETAMGTRINALEAKSRKSKEYIKSIKTMCAIIVDRTFSAIHPFFYKLSWNYYKERSALKVIHQYVDHVIEEKIQERQNNGKYDLEEQSSGTKKRQAFLDLLLDAKIDGRDLTRIELRDEVNTFMFEGHDTTSSAITFCMLMIATHAKIQAKAFEEQKKIFTTSENFKEATPTSSHLSQMKYLELIVKETLRIYPSVPMIGRKLTKDLEYKGSIIPKGTNIGLFPYGSHRKSEYFENPEKFIPERFEISNAGNFPFAYTPFSAGPRNCIGQKFAMMEILCTLSKIIRNFQLAPALPEHKVQVAAESILISKNGVKISLKDR